MLINIINKHAASELISQIEITQQQNKLVGALHICLADMGLSPPETQVISLIRPCVDGRQASLYFLENGDVVVTWYGAQKAILEKLITVLQQAWTPDKKLSYNYFDIQAQGEDFRLLLKEKATALKKTEEQTAAPISAAPAPPAKSNPAMHISEKDVIEFRASSLVRKARVRPEILIVEDQAFSRKILLAVLGDTYKVYESPDAEHALKLYLRYAPDIVFLDIELPGMDGHHLAMLLHRLDPQAYIVMVTGNNQMDDVQRARDNAAKGFIVKPYNKQKIFDAVQKFMQTRK